MIWCIRQRNKARIEVTGVQILRVKAVVYFVYDNFRIDVAVVKMACRGKYFDYQ
jgi:hypothetical protein